MQVVVDPEWVGDLSKMLRKYSAQLGETNQQATCRVAAQFAKQAARRTEPFGDGSEPKNVMHARIEAGMWNVFYVMMSKTAFNRIRREAYKTGQARIPVMFGPGGSERYAKMPVDKMVDDFDTAWRWIESRRNFGRRRHPRRAKVIQQMMIIPYSLFTKMLRRRRKLAGIAKGGWLGAGEAAQKLTRWDGRRAIGTNFLNWARKHRRFGTASWRPEALGTEVTLTHKAENIRNAFKTHLYADEVFDWAWMRTIKWYERTLTEIDNQLAA